VADDSLSAGAVARRLGVAVTTLRTWHQRYGLGPSQHISGRHRRYTAEDLARLEIMQRLAAEGVAPAEAARWARLAPADALLHEPAKMPTPTVPTPTVQTPTVPTPTVPEVERQRTSRSRAGGGFTIPVGRAGPAARGLARAAVRLDSAKMRKILEDAIEADDVVATWDNVLRPVLVGIGKRHLVTRSLVDVEHLLSRTSSEVLGAVPRPASAITRARILLACTDEEQHSLPLEALAAALAQTGVACRILGARVPPAALIDSVRRTGPAVVVLWAHTAETADVNQLRGLLAGPRRPLLVLAGGPGWDPESLPSDVVMPVSLSDAMRLVMAAADLSD
jgi:MerR family transcriptional regulator, light-induced transcriptional regulator